MKCIVNVSKDWGIGNGGDLLVHIPEDMKWFREHTKGCIVVMGRKTLESFPGGKPLKNRINIVMTRDEDYVPAYLSEEVPEGDERQLIITHSLEETLETLEEIKRASERTVSEEAEESALKENASEETAGDEAGPEPVTDDDIYVIGGASIYKQFLPHVDTAVVTKTEVLLPADSFFPDLDKDPDWEISESSEEKEHEGIKFRFLVYKRKKQS